MTKGVFGVSDIFFKEVEGCITLRVFQAYFIVKDLSTTFRYHLEYNEIHSFPAVISRSKLLPNLVPA